MNLSKADLFWCVRLRRARSCFVQFHRGARRSRHPFFKPYADQLVGMSEWVIRVAPAGAGRRPAGNSAPVEHQAIHVTHGRVTLGAQSRVRVAGALLSFRTLAGCTLSPLNMRIGVVPGMQPTLDHSDEAAGGAVHPPGQY